jgi:hypothetical protein
MAGLKSSTQRRYLDNLRPEHPPWPRCQNVPFFGVPWSKTSFDLWKRPLPLESSKFSRYSWIDFLDEIILPIADALTLTKFDGYCEFAMGIRDWAISKFLFEAEISPIQLRFQKFYWLHLRAQLMDVLRASFLELWFTNRWKLSRLHRPTSAFVQSEPILLGHAIDWGIRQDILLGKSRIKEISDLDGRGLRFGQGRIT